LLGCIRDAFDAVFAQIDVLDGKLVKQRTEDLQKRDKELEKLLKFNLVNEKLQQEIVLFKQKADKAQLDDTLKQQEIEKLLATVKLLKDENAQFKGLKSQGRIAAIASGCPVTASSCSSTSFGVDRIRLNF